MPQQYLSSVDNELEFPTSTVSDQTRASTPYPPRFVLYFLLHTTYWVSLL